MTLPLAIHTARQGHDWLNKGQHDLSLLERFRNAIGTMPDLNACAPLSCGVVNDGDWVVVYRFLREKEADFLRRDCIYLAVTWFQRSVAASVHIGRLLEMPVFLATVREPYTCFEYSGGDSCPCACDPAAMTGAELAVLDFAQAGSVFQYPFTGTLRIMQEAGAKTVVAYSEVVPLVLGSEQVRAEESPALEIEVERLAEKVPQKKRMGYIRWSVAAVALLIAAWMLDRGAAKQRHEESLQRSSSAVIASQHVAALFNSTDAPPPKSAKDVPAERYLCWLPTDVSALPRGWQDDETGRIMQLRFLWSSYNNEKPTSLPQRRSEH